MQNLPIEPYLQRIGFQSGIDLTYKTLSALQYAHLHSVPYENLDIVRGIPLSLSVEMLYEKIVACHRGGYCFELNALFGWLLRSLGFEVVDYFARFLLDEKDTIPMRRHHVLSVMLPDTKERYLADVGVGAVSPNYPLILTDGQEQCQGEARYRFDKDSFLGWVLKFEKNGTWQPLFSFTEEPQLPIDFVAASFYCEQSKDSLFNKEPMIALRTDTGRITLDGCVFKQFEHNDVTVWQEETEAAYEQSLQRLFGITL